MPANDSPYRVVGVTERSVTIMLMRNAKNGARKFPKNRPAHDSKSEKITSL